MPNPKSHSFNVLMDTVTYQRLDALADRLSSSKGAVIRDAIAVTFRHIIERRFCCPNAQPCFVPQMHPPEVPPTPPSQQEATNMINETAA